MVIVKRLARIFEPPKVCGPLCRNVSAEIDTMALGDRLEQLARTQRVRCAPSEM